MRTSVANRAPVLAGRSVTRCARRRGRLAAAALALWALAGCTATRPPVEQDIGAATGLGDAIVFRQTPEPLDNLAGAPDAQLTLDQAVRLAVLRDPRIQAALAHVRMAEADANQARLLPNPILNIDIRFPQESGANTAFEATLTGDLVSLLQKPAQIASADQRLRASAADTLVAALDVMNEVQQTYAEAQAAEAQLADAEAQQKRLGELRDMAHKRMDAGEGTKLETLALEGQWMEADLDLADARQTRQESRLKLAKLIGQPRSPAQWKLDAWAAAPASAPAPEAAWIDAALLQRPEIQSKRWELAALGDDLTAAEFSPLAGGEIGAHTEHDPEWRTGPTITTPLPIFDWGQASRAKIQAQQMAARHELSGAQADVIEEVRVAYAAYLQARQSLDAARRGLLPLLSQQLELARLSYQSGETDLATLLLVESEVRRSQARVTDLNAKVAQTRATLQRAAGGAAVAEKLEPPAATAPATGGAP